MRLNTFAIGLLACLSRVIALEEGKTADGDSFQGTAATPTANSYVTYNATVFPTGGVVFSSAQSGSDTIIHWSTENEATVEKVTLYKTGGEGDDGEDIGFGTVATTDDGSSANTLPTNKHSGVTGGKRLVERETTAAGPLPIPLIDLPGMFHSS
jgi:hypothetical protein